jgi:hypothetical protein
MAWGKVDDKLAFHPKVIEAGNEAMGLWVRAMSYACDHLTDGFISQGIVMALGGSKASERLVAAGLWLPVDGGWMFKDWFDYQPTSDDVRERREKSNSVRAEAGKKGAAARWNGKTDSKTDGKPIANGMANEWQTPWQNDSPIPVPVPIDLPKGSSNRGQRIPEDFHITEKMREWATREAPNLDIDRVTESFIDYWRSKAGAGAVKTDWVATWRNWMRRDYDSRPKTTQPPTRFEKNMSLVDSFREGERKALA